MWKQSDILVAFQMSPSCCDVFFISRSAGYESTEFIMTWAECVFQGNKPLQAAP